MGSIKQMLELQVETFFKVSQPLFQMIPAFSIQLWNAQLAIVQSRSVQSDLPSQFQKDAKNPSFWTFIIDELTDYAFITV